MIEKHVFDIDGNIHLEGLTCFFDVREEEYVEEPYTYGGSRGKGKVVSVDFVSVIIGEFNASHDVALRMFGFDAIKRIEGVVRDMHYES